MFSLLFVVFGNVGLGFKGGDLNFVFWVLGNGVW